LGFEVLQRFEFPFGEDITNGLEPPGGVRSAVSADPNEVLEKIVGINGLLDSRRDLVFHPLPLTVLDPAVLGDAYLPRFLGFHLKHPRSRATRCVGANVIEQQ
jgi:hypothetical protein